MTTRPDSEMVAVTWLRSLPELSDVGVATTLPAKWEDAFVVINLLPSGASAYSLLREPLVQVNVFARPKNTSTKPLWARAASLAEEIYWAACIGTNSCFEVLSFGSTYHTVTLGCVEPKREPTRISGDLQAFAGYSLDLAFTYAPNNLVIT